MGWGSIVHSVTHSVAKATNQTGSTIKDETSGSGYVHSLAYKVSASPVTTYVAPYVVGVYTKAGRKNILNSKYGKVAAPIINAYTGGAAGQILNQYSSVAKDLGLGDMWNSLNDQLSSLLGKTTPTPVSPAATYGPATPAAASSTTNWTIIASIAGGILVLLTFAYLALRRK